MTPTKLLEENLRFRGGAGVSPGNRHLGFQSAFRDRDTGRVYLSRFLNGQVAPIHVLDGLPDELVIMRDTNGRVLKVRPSVESGFVRGDCYYTRAQALQAA